jgi:hypothetical protein
MSQSCRLVISPYLCLPLQRRQAVLRILIARLEVELEQTHDPAARAQIEAEIAKLREELERTPE